MCGIAGFLNSRRSSGQEEGIVLVHRMGSALSHRGPDDDGHWGDADAGVFLAHRRLAVVDLSAAGKQPMHSASARFVLVFNGEIYNHLTLRSQLEQAGKAPKWRGHSDTETLLAGFDAWGVQATVERTTGMFAFALWDRETRSLTLGRDRLGEKPLYYGWQGDAFLFGSELKAFRVHPAFTGRVDRGALSLLLRHNYIPAPYCIYEGIAKLAAGTLLTISPQARDPRAVRYWSGADTAVAGAAAPLSDSPEALVSELEVLLKDAVRQQMVADVPLGAFLSGGVDSSTVVALMQAQSPRPVKTFSIGFHEPGYNEAEHAKAVARHLGTDHTELYVSAEQAMAVIPRLPVMYDEPFADDSQIPTFLVSELARQHVTVSLSGDAGDELFCGYKSYQLAAKIWAGIRHVPLSARKLLGRGITAVPAHGWNALSSPLTTLFLGRLGRINLGDKLHKGAHLLASSSSDALYHSLISHWQDPASIVIGGHEPPTLMTQNAPNLPGLDCSQRMMALDMLTYLPDDILVKLDRAAMGVSLETRVPFLDHRVVEFAWRLPQSMKLRDGQTKWALRQVLYRHVPKALVERPKMGFALPIGTWLRGPLLDWAEDLLSEERLCREGYLAPQQIRQRWAEHLSGQRNWQYSLWGVLMFQQWLAHNSL